MSGRIIQTILGRGGDFQDLGLRPLLGSVTEPWNCHGTSGVSFHLPIEDQGLVLSAILVLFDSDWFTLCPWAMSFFLKLCPAPFSPVTKGGGKEVGVVLTRKPGINHLGRLSHH